MRLLGGSRRLKAVRGVGMPLRELWKALGGSSEGFGRLPGGSGRLWEPSGGLLGDVGTFLREASGRLSDALEGSG